MDLSGVHQTASHDGRQLGIFVSVNLSTYLNARFLPSVMAVSASHNPSNPAVIGIQQCN